MGGEKNVFLRLYFVLFLHFVKWQFHSTVNHLRISSMFNTEKQVVKERAKIDSERTTSYFLFLFLLLFFFFIIPICFCLLKMLSSFCNSEGEKSHWHLYSHLKIVLHHLLNNMCILATVLNLVTRLQNLQCCFTSVYCYFQKKAYITSCLWSRLNRGTVYFHFAHVRQERNACIYW